MKRFSIILFSLTVLISLSSCDDWLELYPQNARASDKQWQSQKDVDDVITAGYYYLRDMAIPELIPWGELRAGAIYNIKKHSELQEFQVEPTDKICSWGDLYEIINVANDVLANASTAQKNDKTYEKAELQSHYAEAYFLRALSYFYLVRNWKDVPLVIAPFENDDNNYHIPQTPETVVVEQIKDDIRAALATGAAKERYNTTWQTKGRATKWALYALMADVCLWSEDYKTVETYCDYLLDSESSYAPRFLLAQNRNTWFSIFNPGNSNESIFELQWDHNVDHQTNDLPVLFDNEATDCQYVMTPHMTRDFGEEYASTEENLLEAVRTMYGGYYLTIPSSYISAENGYVWKYCGSMTMTDKRTSTFYDPNFIIYRVSEVILMKAEALIMEGPGEDNANWKTAVDLINKIRTRSNLENRLYNENITQEELLSWLLHEYRMEFLGEGKLWYVLLRFGRRDNYKYKNMFLVDQVVDYDNQVSSSWLTSVLSDNNALFLPVNAEEIKTDSLLVQNPYYDN